MQTVHLYIIAFAFIVIAGSPFNVLAQTEADEERSSLRGLNGVGFTVNIEQNTAYADTQLVNISTVKKLGMQELEKAEITIFDDIEIQESIRTPVLYMHINLLSTRTGIISFSVTVSLYQPVKLVLNRDKQATAITWENSIVGIASYDKIGVIKQAVVGMIQSFIDDYQKVNSN